MKFSIPADGCWYVDASRVGGFFATDDAGLSMVGAAISNHFGQPLNYVLGGGAAAATFCHDAKLDLQLPVKRIHTFVNVNHIPTNMRPVRRYKPSCLIGDKYSMHSKIEAKAVIPNPSIVLEIHILIPRSASEMDSLDVFDIASTFDINSDQIAVKVAFSDGSWRIDDSDGDFVWKTTDAFDTFLETRKLSIPKLLRASPASIVTMAERSFQLSLSMELPPNHGDFAHALTAGKVDECCIEVWNSFNDSFLELYPSLRSFDYEQVSRDDPNKYGILKIENPKFQFFLSDNNSSDEDSIHNPDEDFLSLSSSSSLSDESFRADMEEDDLD
jgi:hypothetical protein